MRRVPTGPIITAGNECPVTGCDGRRERSQHIMCRHCWRLVHSTLQGQVWAALGERNHVAAARATREQLRRAVETYEDLRRRAIATAERARYRRAAA